MSQEIPEHLVELSQRIDYKFQDVSLLARALKHRSAGSLHNERFEFLGDAVLGFVISAELFARHKKAKEGELSRLRSFLVNGEMLSAMALEFKVNEHLELGEGERKSGGATRNSILADALEAIIGAIYLDGGVEAVRTCILQWYGEQVDDLATLKPDKDAKSQLQEWLQAKQFPLPEYALTTFGEAHALTFEIVCTVVGLPYSTRGKSNSRRKAEQIAASHYLEILNEKHT